MAKERSGYVYQDNVGRWYARLTFTTAHGKRHDVKRRAGNAKAAKKVLSSMLREMEEQGSSSLEARNMTFEQLSDYYQQHYLTPARYIGERKVSGVRSISPVLAALKPLKEHFGTRRLQHITYSEIRSYRAMRLGTATRCGTQRTIAAVNRELAKLRRLLNIAQREGWILRNPFSIGESLISAADENRRERILTRDEERKLLEAVDSEPKRAHLRGILLIALDCGLRRGEIFTLAWSDVDLVCRTIRVRAFNCKTARARTVAMTARVYEELQTRWLAAVRKPDDLVFGVSVTIKTSFAKVCKVAGIADFHFHDCRHTAITRMIRAGMPPVEVMRISGHTTMSAFYRYANSDLETARRAASALDSFNSQPEPDETEVGMVN